MTERFSRRRFLSHAVGAGAGAVAAFAVGGTLDAARSLAAVTPVLTAPPGTPPAYQHFVTRPDLRPVGVWIDKTSAAVGAGQPAYIFAATGPGLGSPFPTRAQPGLMIFDRNGSLVWFRALTAATAKANNFGVQTYQGKPVLTWFQGTVPLGFATAGAYYLADDSYTTIRTLGGANGVPADLHEFLLTPEGTALHTGYQYLGKEKLYAGHATEVDVATGDVVFDWSSYPAVPPSLSYVPGEDYFHINSIDLWPGSERNLLISSRHTSAVYLIERSSGRILWRVGGKASTFAMVGAATGTRFEYQHDARALADGTGFSVFDDGSAALGPGIASPPTPEHQAWAKVFNLDTATKQVTLRHQFNHSTEPLVVPYSGSNQLLANGDRFVGWGAQPWFSQFAALPDGAGIVLDGRFPGGVTSYRTFTAHWTGRPPLDELSFVVLRGSAPGSFTGYVSWNGATEVARWHFSAGTSSGALGERASGPRQGFETAMSFTASGATHFRATAYSAAGAELGTSDVVSAT